MTVQEPTSPSELFSPFLPTTQNIPEEEDVFKNFLNDKFSGFADVINDKKIGVISQAAENFSGLKAFYKTTQVTRNGFWTLAYIPSFPNTTTLTLTLTSTPQFPIVGIDPNFVVWQVWGSASKPCSAKGADDGDYFSFYSEGNSKVTFTMSDTEIIITTTTDLSAYSGFIIIEYIRAGT
jgi:hypothetical protein